MLSSYNHVSCKTKYKITDISDCKYEDNFNHTWWFWKPRDTVQQNGAKNTVSCSQPNPSLILLSLEEVRLATTLLNLHLFWSSSWKRIRKQGCRRTPWQPGEGADFPEILMIEGLMPCEEVARSHQEQKKARTPGRQSWLTPGNEVWGRSEKDTVWGFSISIYNFSSSSYPIFSNRSLSG